MFMLLRIITIFKNSSNGQLFGSLTWLPLKYVVMLPFCFGLLYCRSEKDFLEVITFCSDSTRRCLNWPVQKACHAVTDTGPTLPVQEKIPSANPNSLANQWEMIYRMTNSASSRCRAQAVSNVTTFSTLPVKPTFFLPEWWWSAYFLKKSLR